MVGQVNAFSADSDDEFRVTRENGSTQGIFKTCAVPVIPFLDAGALDVLALLWPKLLRYNQLGLPAALRMLADRGNNAAAQATAVLDGWKRQATTQPLAMFRSLEQARLNSWLLDKRLAILFNRETLPAQPAGRIRLLVSRLSLAFGLLNPFYNLEAFVGAQDSLVGENQTDSGVLDIVPFFLPAALRNFVVAEAGNWNGLSWEKLREMAGEAMLDARRRKMLLGLTRLAGVPVHHILFAANVLEWIPRRVGGKKADSISSDEALAQLDKAISGHFNHHSDPLAGPANLNALIRFLNWIPLVEGQENFQGRNWTYSSVCDTTEDLLAELAAHPESWRDGFGQAFLSVLKPQIENLDATSAKGRLLLHLIVAEKRLEPEFFSRGLGNGWRAKIIRSVAHPPADEALSSTKAVLPPSLVGGKPFNLALANHVLPAIIPEGFVVSADMVGSLLRENERLWQTVVLLSHSSSLKAKLVYARQIRLLVSRMEVPCWLESIIAEALARFPEVTLWAVRSSSQDEAEARGIYRSLLRVPRRRFQEAVLRCVASFFSPGAVKFRMLAGAGDLPDFAVYCLAYRRAEGGVATISRDCCTISVGKTAAHVTSGKPVQREIKGRVKKIRELPAITSILCQLEKAFGAVQIEWLEGLTTGPILLQLEFLGKGRQTKPRTVARSSAKVCRIESLKELGRVRLTLERQQEAVAIRLGAAINLDLFQGELLSLLVQHGNRVSEVRLHKPISPSSHFANICHYLGIAIR